MLEGTSSEQWMFENAICRSEVAPILTMCHYQWCSFYLITTYMFHVFKMHVSENQKIDKYCILLEKYNICSGDEAF